MKTRLAIIIGILLVIAFGVLVAQEDTVTNPYYIPATYEYGNINMMESMPDIKLNTYYFYINPLVAIYADGEWGFNVYGLSIKDESGVKTEKVIIENTGRLEMKIEAWESVGYPDYTIKEGYNRDKDVDLKTSLEMRREYYASVYEYWYSQGFTAAESKKRADEETGGSPISGYPEGYDSAKMTKDENDPYWLSLRNVWIKRGFDTAKAGEFATAELDTSVPVKADGNNDKVIDFSQKFNKRKIYFYIKDATFFLLKDNKLVEKVTGADLKLKTDGSLGYRLKLNPTRIVMIEDLQNFMGGYFETTTVVPTEARTTVNTCFTFSGRLTPDFIRIRDAAFYPCDARKVFKNLPGKFSVEEYKRTIANLNDVRSSLIVKTWSANKIVEKDGNYYDSEGKEVAGYAGVLKYLKDNKANNPFFVDNPIADVKEGLRNVQRAFFGYQFDTPIDRVKEEPARSMIGDPKQAASKNWIAKFKAMTQLGPVDVPVDVPVEIAVADINADGKYLATMTFTFGTVIVTLNNVEIKEIVAKDKDGNILKNADGTDLKRWGFEGAEATVDATFFQFFNVQKDSGVIVFEGFFDTTFNKIQDPAIGLVLDRMPSTAPFDAGGVIRNKEDNSVLAKWSASK